VERNQELAEELERMAQVVGKGGNIFDRGEIKDGVGSWGECINSLNNLISDLVQPTIQAVLVIEAVAQGSVSLSIELKHGRRDIVS